MHRDDPEELLRDIGRKIAERRAELGLTQEQLAERLGVNTRYLARLERGGQNLTVHRLAWLASRLELRVAQLFEAPHDRTVKKGRPRRTER